eukprot:CAMPEP_0202844854 /NCGR_PEP_ID=MMETSP1389-20130828/68412_1 /ASSEMBLY_ACC=CAM_ASM_000865 /TAXON_ID=302021 /ORGANISM="Rhodomonas sp., Strain CCMP768" /LENGTH=61 /DNA_ID=CAMNT_0049522215 /DNA_START=37 /DNA_END=219 /DNA_ORIENTATION=-
MSDFLVSSSDCFWKLMDRWSQQLPRSWNDLDVLAASPSPACCSWLPMVMRVSPNSARDPPK